MACISSSLIVKSLKVLLLTDWQLCDRQGSLWCCSLAYALLLNPDLLFKDSAVALLSQQLCVCRIVVTPKMKPHYVWLAGKFGFFCGHRYKYTSECHLKVHTTKPFLSFCLSYHR